MSDLVEAYALLRLEELRADIRAELEEATTWPVRACTPPALAVQVGPHRADVPVTHPVRGRIDLVVVTFVDGHVRPQVLPGTPSTAPLPPAVPLSSGILIAMINMHAASSVVYQHNIVRLEEAR